MSCADVIEGKTCPDIEPTLSMCVCKPGYYLQKDACVEAATYRDDIYSGEYSPWSDWTECSVTCGVGSKSKVRMCMGPGACRPYVTTYKVIECENGACVPGGETCAIVYDKMSAYKSKARSFETGSGSISDLSTVLTNGESWAKSVSYIEVQPECVFSGYEEPDHKTLLG